MRQLVWMVGVCLIPASGWAQFANESQRCVEDAAELDESRYLRALSLDLRGNVPTPEEYGAMSTPEDAVDTWLEEEGFVERSVRFHQSLLWPNLSNLRLARNNFRLGVQGGIYWRGPQAPLYRNGPGGTQRQRCRDEPARWNDAGEILTTRDTIDGEQYDREGWVLVEPYWAPGETVRVCAFDAQEARLSPSGTNCASPGGTQDAGCGCGPNLMWCLPGQAERVILASMAEAINRRLAKIFRSDDPYLELFTSKRTFINGPLVHYWTHQTFITNAYQMRPAPFDVSTLPDLDYADVDRWEEIELPGAHAGVLTDPVFLLRFQTNRARANRYYTSFLCTPFSPPPGGLPAPDDDCSSEPDLQRRCGCKYCHALLEPTGAFWGRWSQQGAAYLSPEEFPPTREDCEDCGLTGRQCSADCRNLYVTQSFSDEQDAFIGSLQAYEFRQPQHHRNIEHGPRLLALETTVDNNLPLCTARNAAHWLLGREVTSEEEPWLEDLARGFVSNDYSWRWLVKSVVTSDLYRRVR